MSHATPQLLGVRSRRLLTWVSVLLSAHFAIAYNTLTTPMVPFTPDRPLNGHGTPFDYRMAPTLLWKLSVALLAPLHRRLPRLHFPHLNKPFSSNEEWFMALLTFGTMLGTLLVARRILRTIDDRPAFEWIALGMAYSAYFDTVLVLNRNLFYPYDVPALFFFTLLVYLAKQRLPVAFTLTLVAAMVNKETAIMAVLVYFGLSYGKQTLSSLCALCAGMGALAIGVRLMQRVYVHHICASCQKMAEYHLKENVVQIVNPLFWISELSVFGFAYLAAVVFWRYVPHAVRITALAVSGSWIAAMMVLGIMREVRVFSELSALLLLVAGLGVHGWLDRDRRGNGAGELRRL